MNTFVPLAIVAVALLLAMSVYRWCRRAGARRHRARDTTRCGCQLCPQSNDWFYGAFVAIAVNNPDLTAVGRAIAADLFEMPEEES